MFAEQATHRCMHLPARPDWNCQSSGQPWPCPIRKVALGAEYRHNRTSLVIYLAFHLADAIDDFGRLDRGPVPDLFERFLGWARWPTA